MINKLSALPIAAIACSALVISAQAQAPAPAPKPAPQTSSAQTPSPAATTIVGCVFEEKDVPGRSPNVAERAGILEDYILAEIKPASGGGAVGTSGSAQLGTMYKLEHVDDSKLKAFVGKRVEVTGRLDRESGDSTARPSQTPPPSGADKVLGRDNIDLAEFEVISVKEVSGACPSTAKAP